MLRLLGKDPEFLEPSSIPMPEGLALTAKGGFIEADGCVVSRSISGVDSTRRILASGDDETGIEAALSEVNIERFLDEPVDPSELSRLGLDFGLFLRKELMRSGLAGPFRVIVSTQLADPTLNMSGACTVRFHRKREGQVWLDDALENYKSEAVAVLDF